MKEFNWDEEKNKNLKKLRGVSFEDVVFHIENDFLIAVVDHPNKIKYKGQKMFIVNINDYVHLVPFIESEKELFLKTIIPSRKATKKFLGG